MTAPYNASRISYDVYTTKNGKYQKLGTLDPNTNVVMGIDKNVIFTYKRGYLQSKKTGITYSVDSAGNIYDNAMKVGIIKNYSDLLNNTSRLTGIITKAKSLVDFKTGSGSSAFTPITYKVAICLLIFECIALFLPAVYTMGIYDNSIGVLIPKGSSITSLWGLVFALLRYGTPYSYALGTMGVVITAISIIMLVMLIRKRSKTGLFLIIGGILCSALMFVIPKLSAIILNSPKQSASDIDVTTMSSYEIMQYISSRNKTEVVTIGYSFLFYLMLLGFIAIIVIGCMHRINHRSRT